MEGTARGVRLTFTALVVDLAITAVAPVVQVAIFRVAGPDVPLAPLATGLVLGGVVGALLLVAFRVLYAGRSERGADDARRMGLALGLAIVVGVASIVQWTLRILGVLSEGIAPGWVIVIVLDLVVAVAAGSAFYAAYYGLLDPTWRTYSLLATAAGAASASIPTVVVLALEAASDPTEMLAVVEIVAAAGWILGAISLATFVLACRQAGARLAPTTP